MQALEYFSQSFHGPMCNGNVVVPAARKPELFLAGKEWVAFSHQGCISRSLGGKVVPNQRFWLRILANCDP
jgi:hypothetical protein